MQIDLNDVRMFVAVAKAGTFSSAAKELGLPTSTVSRAITRLEQSTEAMLYQRSTKGLRLTDAGKQYLGSCKRALRSLKDGRELLEKHRASPGGMIRIMCPVTLARDLLSPILVEFVQAYPSLRVEIEPYASGWDQEPLDDVDIFFKLRAPKDSTRRMRCFPGTARGLFASATYLERNGTPTEPDDLPNHRCIGSGLWKLSRGDAVVTPEILFQVVTSDPSIHIQLSCRGAGIAILPLWMVQQPNMEELLLPVLPDWKPEPITICALYSGAAKLTPKVRIFLDFLAKYFGTERDPRLGRNKTKDLFTDANLPFTAGP